MKFADIENIWTVDITCLSNADRGRVYFERAKQVVDVALSDSAEFDRARKGRRLRRTYLIEQINCQPGVTTQNPKIKALLFETDARICKVLDQEEASSFPVSESTDLVRNQ